MPDGITCRPRQRSTFGPRNPIAETIPISKKVNVDFPAWMVQSLDREAKRLGVPRQSVIKLWIAERLGAKA